MKKYLTLVLILFITFNGYSQYRSGSYVQLVNNVKLRETSNFFSKPIGLIPKGGIVKILYHTEYSTYKVEYGSQTGFIRSVYSLRPTSRDATDYLKQNYDTSLNKQKEEQSDRLPPILTITSVDFSEKVLDGNETAKLEVSVKNSGPGDARDAFVILSGNLRGLKYLKKSYFPTIKGHGDTKTISIDIIGGLELPTSEVSLKIEVVEPYSKIKLKGKDLRFPTREFQKPELILAQYNVIENQSGMPNKQIDINEMIDLKFAVQNIGQGNAKSVSVEVKNNQSGVVLLGVVNGNTLKKGNPNFSQIQSGKFETLVYRYFVNSDFNDNELKFIIKSKERNGKFGFTETKSFPINTVINEIGYIRRIAETDNAINNYGEVRIDDIPNFVVDVDTNIPETKTKQIHTYALIIGNEDYQSRQKGLSVEQNVDFAINDAQVFAMYCEKTLGIPNNQIKVLNNATSAQISQGLAWINNLSEIENGNAKLIFFYSGHGLPDEKTKEPYLIPVDVSGINLQYGIKISDVYKSLTEHPSKQVTVFLDACFSGGARNQGLLAMKGIKVKPNKNVVSGNTIVFSSSSGNESSAVFREKQHGYFTYYLLKKLKETKGETDYLNLANYIVNSVRKQVGLIGKKQTPELNVSLEVEDKWKLWKLK